MLESALDWGVTSAVEDEETKEVKSFPPIRLTVEASLGLVDISSRCSLELTDSLVILSESSLMLDLDKVKPRRRKTER
ncbi:unnamed protein product [Schistosoma mattheei]|uniref:Uncharacterized protein n=1 Tax=Schistosoma mattheei TaxID=31246 RepID=A0A183Q386_9TREM|nr:unnamed protein product [Schistosoma mattheei]